MNSYSLFIYVYFIMVMGMLLYRGNFRVRLTEVD